MMMPRGAGSGMGRRRFLGLEPVLAVLEDLGAVEDGHHDAEHAPHHRARDAQASIQQVGMERAHASPRRIARWRPNNQSTSIPATAVVALWSGDHTSSSHPSSEPLSFPDAIATTRLRSQVPAKNR